MQSVPELSEQARRDEIQTVSVAVTSSESGGVRRMRTTGSVAAPSISSLGALQDADPIDAALRAYLKIPMGKDQLVLSKLRVNRLSCGEYEIDGRRVSLRWAQGVDTGLLRTASSLLVREAGVGGGSAEVSFVTLGQASSADVLEFVERPLLEYLHQAADVNASLEGRAPGAPAVARIPQDKRLSFNGPGVDALGDDYDALVRTASMRQAVEEARLREQAAEAYSSARSWERPPSNWHPQVPTSPLGGSRGDAVQAGALWSKRPEPVSSSATRISETLARIMQSQRPEEASEEESSEEDEDDEDDEIRSI